MKLGILGGTFDPIHNGHLRLAIEAHSRFNLDRIICLPTPKPDYRDPPIASFEQRCLMAQLAIEPLSFCTLHRLVNEESDEQTAEALSKTCHALDQLRQYWGEDQDYFFILGEDSFLTLSQWHHADQIANHCKFLVFQRNQSEHHPQQPKDIDFPEPLFPEPLFPEPLLALAGPTQDFVQLLSASSGWTYANAPLLDISASYVRACLNHNVLPHREHLHGLVPDPVLCHIHTHGLYRETNNETQTREHQ